MSSVTNKSTAVILETFDGSAVTLLFSVVRDFGISEDFLYGQSYYRALIFFVPRSLYPGKPPNITVVLANIYEPGEATSLSATVLGELYANFAILGLLLLPAITAVLLRVSSRMRTERRPNTLSQTIGCVFLIHSIRFGLPAVGVDYLIAVILYRVGALEKMVSRFP